MDQVLVLAVVPSRSEIRRCTVVPHLGGGQDRFVMRMAGDTLWLTNVPGGFRWSNGKSDTSTNDSFTLVRER